MQLGSTGTLQQILLGPSSVPDGTMNLTGALRKANPSGVAALTIAVNVLNDARFTHNCCRSR